jgi:hypothetical protein
MFVGKRNKSFSSKCKRHQSLPVVNVKFLPLATSSFHDLYFRKMSNVPEDQTFQLIIYHQTEERGNVEDIQSHGSNIYIYIYIYHF